MSPRCGVFPFSKPTQFPGAANSMCAAFVENWDDLLTIMSSGELRKNRHDEVLRIPLPRTRVNRARRPGRRWVCFLPPLLRVDSLLCRPKIRFGPLQSGLRLSERSRPPAREACVVRGYGRLQPTFAGAHRRSATFPNRPGTAHLRLVTFRAAWLLLLPVLGGLQLFGFQLRGNPFHLEVCALLLASEAPRTRIGAR
jgi:hypothetical protein